MIDPASGRKPPKHSESGLALVVILSLVVLLSLLVVTFLVRSSDSQKGEAVSAGGVQAELIARDAIRIIADDFRKEIEAGSQSPASDGVYVPTSPLAMRPDTVLVSGSMKSDSRFDGLIKQSGAGRFFSASAPYAASPEPLLRFASGIPASEPSVNRRVLSADRWNAPRLLPSGGFSDASELPHWVYVDKNLGPVDATAAARELTGRFAFNIYSVGGRLNINVSGAPDVRNTAAVVGTQGGVEPRELPGGASANGLLAWRNAATGGTGPDFSSYLRNAGPRAGFLATPDGDRRFLTRRDLILATTTRFSGLEGALPFVTHFSRTVASPGLAAAAPTAVNPYPAQVRHGNAATLTTYTIAGDSLTYPVHAGDPLMPYRFSLDRTQWLTHAGPASTAMVEPIRACFGLQWNGTGKRWEFVGSDGGSSLLDEIPTLAQVAARKREPNFFEVLKAAIAVGSLGNAPALETLSPGAAVYDQVKDLQILRIGANLIDCADTDNFPTRIAMMRNGTAVTASGIEDLPYLWGAFLTSHVLYSDNKSGSPSKYPRHRSTLLLTPLLFNPHAASPAAASSGPQSIRVRAEGRLALAQFRADATSGGAGGGSYYTFAGPAVDLAAKAPLEITIGTASFRALPDIPKVASANAARLAAQLGGRFGGDALGFVLLDTAHVPPLEPVGTSTSPANVRLEDANLVLEYRDGSDWIAYDTLSGVADAPGATGITQGAATAYNLPNVGSRVRLVDPAAPTVPATPFTDDDLTRTLAPKWDPRTTRFALSYAPGALYGGGASGSANQMPASSVKLTNLPPFASVTNASLLSLPQGGETAVADPGQAADPDGVVRPADGYLGDKANPLKGGAFSTARPLVLQRPFRNAGELGFVFRDTPWKTVDLFTGQSGDGALLEFFCAGESIVTGPSGQVVMPPVAAGKIDLNCAPPEVLAALLANAFGDDSASSSRLSAAQSEEAARALAAAAKTAPLTSLASIPAWNSVARPALSEESQTAKRAAEQISRALASAGAVRTWNFCIDVIAQSGKFPPSAVGGALNRFVVEGESRFWVFMAVDRLSGKVIETRFEPPFE